MFSMFGDGYLYILHVRTTVTGMIFGCLITQLLGNNKTVFCLLQIRLID